MRMLDRWKKETAEESAKAASVMPMEELLEWVSDATSPVVLTRITEAAVDAARVAIERVRAECLLKYSAQHAYNDAHAAEYELCNELALVSRDDETLSETLERLIKVNEAVGGIRDHLSPLNGAIADVVNAIDLMIGPKP